MKELLYFKLVDCPYCVEADKWIEELIEENLKYKDINIRVVNEKKEMDFANTYNYYYVPTFFYGETKLHEGVATKDKIRAALNYALENTDL